MKKEGFGRDFWDDHYWWDLSCGAEWLANATPRLSGWALGAKISVATKHKKCYRPQNPGPNFRPLP